MDCRSSKRSLLALENSLIPPTLAEELSPPIASVYASLLASCADAISSRTKEGSFSLTISGPHFFLRVQSFQRLASLTCSLSRVTSIAVLVEIHIALFLRSSSLLILTSGFMVYLPAGCFLLLEVALVEPSTSMCLSY